MEKRLVRSTSDRVVAGVCGGLAQYLGIDAVLVRIGFILFSLSGGAGVLIYLILWLIIPGENVQSGDGWDQGGFSLRANTMRDEFVQFTSQPNPQAARYAGIALLGLGVIYLLRAFDIPWLNWLDADLLWPLALILVGAILLWRAFGGRKS